MLTIEITNTEYTAFAVDIRRAAETTLLAMAEPGDPAGLTIVLSDDQQLRALNNEYLGIDAPTDVLAFPADQIDPDTGERYLGDILISLERARLQAEAGGHALADELQLLVVHGMLHLLGYDHGDPDEKERMWSAQADLLHALGLSLSPP
jgi:probable rRNA maturation factor